MNLNYIKAFYYVAKLGSISQASRYLKVSQPTITKKVRMLEESIGFPLISRGARGVKLTADGRRIYNHAQRLIEEINSMEMVVSASRTEVIRISTTNGIGAHLLPRVLAGMNLNPDYSVEISGNFNHRPSSEVDTDVYIGPFIEGLEKEYQVHHLFDFAFYFYVSKKYLNNRTVPTELNDLKKHDLIGFADERREAFEETQLSHILTDPEFQQPLVTVNSAYAEIDLAHRGVGIALLCDIAVKHFKPKISKLELADFDGIKTPAYFFIRKETGRDKALFIKKLYSSFQNDLKQATLQDEPA